MAPTDVMKLSCIKGWPGILGTCHSLFSYTGHEFTQKARKKGFLPDNQDIKQMRSNFCYFHASLIEIVCFKWKNMLSLTPNQL